MTTVAADAFTRGRARASVSVAPALAVAAFASIGAGAIHAAAIGVHSEHHQAVITFTVIAAAQIGWGALAPAFPGRLSVLAGAAANAGIFAGWVLAKTEGISFIDGLEATEDVQFADGVAATLAAVAVLGAVVAVWRGLRPTSLGHSALVISALVTALVAVPAMVSAGSHAHAGGHDEADAASGEGHHATGATETDATTTAIVPPKPYDPTKPIDLGGVPGVTPEQQARAENLIAISLIRLPKFSDPAVAEANGFRSIGDAATGDEHYVNTAYMNDGRELDPDYPESLVYQPDGAGGKKLAAAMYMAEPGTTLETVPDVGGTLTQWHIHNNLCFTDQGRVGGLSSGDGSCRPPLVEGPKTPMIHVWIQPHPCGPFAALEGIGSGQIAEGETRLCDAAHGGH